MCNYSAMMAYLYSRNNTNNPCCLRVILYLFLIYFCVRKDYQSFVSASVYIPQVLVNEVKAHLGSMHTVYNKNPMDKVSLLCRTKVWSDVMKEFPQATTRWKFNGDNFVLQPVRMAFDLKSITIQNLVPSDSGVYQCDVIISSKQHLTIAVYSLVVGEEAVSVYTGDTLELDCHSVALGNLFKNSIKKWKHGDKIVVQKKASEDSVDSLSDASKSTAGVWTCEVQDSERLWTTARYNINIKPPLPPMKRLRRYVKTHKVVSMAILGGACFFVVLMINLLTMLLDKLKKRKTDEMDFYKKHLGLEKKPKSDSKPLLGSKAEINLSSKDKTSIKRSSSSSSSEDD